MKAKLVDDAVLDLGLREGGVDGRIKSRQIVCTGDENILCAPAFHAVECSDPELGAFVFTCPHTQYILAPVQVDAYDDVRRLLHNLSLAADMVMDGVQKYHRIDGLRRPLLPLFGDGKDLVVQRLAAVAVAAVSVSLFL